MSALALLALAVPADAQSSGVIDLIQSASGVVGCTLAPTSYAATCPGTAGVGVLAAGPVVATARASAAVGGPLRAASTIQVTNGTAASYQTFARAGYYDALTVSGPVQPTVARFFVAGDGTGSTSTDFDWSSSSPTVASYGILFFANYGAASVPGTYPTSPGVRQFLITPNVGTVTGFIDVPLVAGVNNILFALSAVSRVGRPQSVPAGAAWSGTATADYLNTGEILGLNFLDAAGNDVSAQVTASFASGVTLAAVPEPGTVALLGGGLLVLGAAVRRRHVRRPRAAVSAVALGLIAAILLPHAAQAQSVGAQARGFGPDLGPNGANCFDGGPGVTYATAACAVPSAVYSADAWTAQGGPLRARASLAVSNDARVRTAYAFARFDDALTLPSTAAAGPSRVELTYAFDGASTASPGFDALGQLSVIWFDPAGQVQEDHYLRGPQQSGTFTFAHTTMPGSTLGFRVFVIAAVENWIEDDPNAVPVPNGSGTADYSHTALLTGFVVRDGVGADVTPLVRSASGVDYAAVAAINAAPEPGAVALLASGLATLGLAARRRAGRSRA